MLQRQDFVNRLAQKGYTKQDALMIIEDFVSTVREILAEGESVCFRGFGNFEVRERAGRESVSTTGERIYVPPYRAPHFAPAKRLKYEVKEGVVRD